MPTPIFTRHGTLKPYYMSPLFPNDINKARFRAFRQKYHPSLLGRSARGPGAQQTGLGRNPGRWYRAGPAGGSTTTTAPRGRILAEEDIQIYGGLVSLIFISFACVSNLEASINTLARRVNSNKQDYADLQQYLPALENVVKILSKDKAQHLSDTTTRDLSLQTWDSTANNGAGARKKTSPPVPSGDYAICDDDVLQVGRLLTKMNLTATGQPEAKGSIATAYTLATLRASSPAVETLIALKNQVTKKSIYLSTLSTQEAQEIQASTSIYQVNIQYCSALISLLKTIGGAIVQRF